MDSQPDTPIPPRCRPRGCCLTLAARSTFLFSGVQGRACSGEASPGGGGSRQRTNKPGVGPGTVPPSSPALRLSHAGIPALPPPAPHHPRAMNSQLSCLPGSSLSPSLNLWGLWTCQGAQNHRPGQECFSLLVSLARVSRLLGAHPGVAGRVVILLGPSQYWLGTWEAPNEGAFCSF